MTSTPEQRHAEIERTYYTAKKEYDDFHGSATEEQFNLLVANEKEAHINLQRANNSFLSKNNESVEDAYLATQTANDAVTKAIEDQVAWTDRIEMVTSAAADGKTLIEKAFNGIRSV